MAEDHISQNQSLPNPENNRIAQEIPARSKPSRQWSSIWEQVLRMGLGEAVMRAGTVCASIALVLLVLWVMESFYLKGNKVVEKDPVAAAVAAPLPTPTAMVEAPPYQLVAQSSAIQGITRLANLHTMLPDRPRFEMTTYEVQQGDTIIGIADKFGLKPQSILWGNFDTLADDPHRLHPGQKLNILPLDGVLYTWHAGDGLNGVSKYFGVTPEDIINWPANNLTAEKVGDFTNPNIEAGTQLFVPNGSRPFISWSSPLISRKDPASAKIFGPGYCGQIVDGYIGSGAFVWPTTEHWLSGYDYSPSTNHWGIDIAGKMGNAIYAADSGVVVYAGWNDWGYGNVIVIDHGNGWQTLYGHLSQLYVGCGASVSSGASIAAMGSTGNSSGPHLHFEIMNQSRVRVNPWDYLTK
jgi:murein DD-endopeptidase MepM/ murein hydrolase activator NlpD